MNPFMAYLFRMRYIQRWSLMKNTETENLEEHALEVALLAHCLALIRRDVLHIPCDPESVAAAALYHDAPEAMTGDLPTPVKYASPEIRRAYGEIEESARARMLEMLPEELRESYRPLLNPDAREDYPLIKAADRLAAYLKCLREEKAGNGEFRRAGEQTRDALMAMELPEVDYFLREFLPAFRLTLHEIIPI